MKTSVIIPNWNGVEKLRRNLPAVLEAAHIGNVEEIIVADDASTDGSVKMLKSEFPEVIVIESRENKNRGFASNVNIGVSKAQGELIVLLNTDASPAKDFLEFAIPHFENQKVFSVGCNVGGLWTTAKFENGFFWHNQALNDEDKEVEAHQTLWVSGGSGIFRKDIWDQLKGLDILYNPFYVEDLDLGYRATKRGYINIWEPKSKVEHYQEKGVIEKNFSKNVINKTAERNMLIFTWKNITSLKLMAEHRSALIKRLITHPKYWSIFLAALKKYPQIMKKREIEKKEAKMTDEEIFNLFGSN